MKGVFVEGGDKGNVFARLVRLFCLAFGSAYDGSIRIYGNAVIWGGIAPPGGPLAEIANGEEGCNADDQDQCNCADPAHARLKRFTPLHAVAAHVGCEGRPTAVIVHKRSAFVRTCLEEAVSPVVFVQANCTCVSAHNSLAENAAGELAELLLLQRNQMTLADFGNLGDFFQRDATGNSSRAQVFAKSAHR